MPSLLNPSLLAPSHGDHLDQAREQLGREQLGRAEENHGQVAIFVVAQDLRIAGTMLCLGRPLERRESPAPVSHQESVVKLQGAWAGG